MAAVRVPVSPASAGFEAKSAIAQPGAGVQSINSSFDQARSCAAGGDVAVDLAAGPDEDDAVTSRIAPVKFHLRVRHGNVRAIRDHPFAVGDDGDVVIAFDLEGIGLERIRLAAAGKARMVGLPEALEPFTDVRGRAGPPAVVSRGCRRTTRCGFARCPEPGDGAAVGESPDSYPWCR